MLGFLSKCSSAAWKPICLGRGNLCNFEIPTPSYKRSSVCPFTNISGCQDKITGDSKKNQVSVIALDVINGFIKGNKDYVYLNNFQKCKFHSSLTHSNNHRGYGEYQDPEKRKANILIFLTLLLALAIIWGNYKMDMSPYDKPAQKTEKL